MRGHLFGDRYKVVLVQQGDGDYFRTLIDYVHLNPVRAKLVDPKDGIETYPWTSLSYYLASPSKRQKWQIANDGLRSAGHPDTASGRRKFLESLEWRAKADEAEKAGLTEIEDQSLQSTLRRRWYFGTQAFRDKLLKLADTAIAKRRNDPNHFGPQIREHGGRKALAIIKRGLDELDLTRAQLPGLPKSDWRKCLIALAVKRHTSMKLSWISEHLAMGVTSAISNNTKTIAKRLDGKGERTLKSHYKKIALPPR